MAENMEVYKDVEDRKTGPLKNQHPRCSALVVLIGMACLTSY